MAFVKASALQKAGRNCREIVLQEKGIILSFWYIEMFVLLKACLFSKLTNDGFLGC